MDDDISEAERNLLGYCPTVGCGAPGDKRERRPNGCDVCERGHVYPTSEAMQRPTVFTELPSRVELVNALAEAKCVNERLCSQLFSAIMGNDIDVAECDDLLREYAKGQGY